MSKTLHANGYDVHYEGGRLADVYILGRPVETVQVRDYNFATGEFGRMPTDAQILARVARFIDEAGGIELYHRNASAVDSDDRTDATDAERDAGTFFGQDASAV